MLSAAAGRIDDGWRRLILASHQCLNNQEQRYARYNGERKWIDTLDWRWEGTLWDFVDVVQWAMLMHRLNETHETDAWEILSDPERVRKKAENYGITRRAIVREMLRIGQDGEAVFRAIDRHNNGDDNSDSPCGGR